MNEKEFKIKIDGIDIIEKALYKHSVLETDNFNHKIITQAIANHEKKLAVVFVLIQIHKMDETNELLGKIVVGVGFDIENFDDVFPKNENGVIIFPVELENFLKGIAISTVRGVMFSEFRGTVLHRAILPIILLDSLKPADANDISLMEMISPAKKP